jgi:hypothetical protein
MKLTSEDVQVLASKAFCLEAIADKKDCTTRFVDLPNRPLEDFVLAGVNVGPAFAAFAADRLAGKQALFDRFSEALDASNVHKSAKFINFGLLEIMFPIVAARLQCEDPKKVIDVSVQLMRRGTPADAQHMIAAREKAFSTSTKREQKMREIKPALQAASPYEFYMTVLKNVPEETSSHQWTQHYKNSLPWIREQFDYLQTHTDEPILERIKHAFDPVREQNPDISIGLLADMSAAAVFLHLSFQK